MPKIIDCFTFFNENDLLDLRLKELYPVVDAFVIVHSNMTFRGVKKQNYLDYQRFQSYRGKIYEVWHRDIPGDTPWEREIFQRNLIKSVLTYQAARQDTIIISDVDEIPRRSAVKPVDKEHRLVLDKYSYAINMLTNEGNTAARILPWSDWGDRTAEQIRRDDCPDLILDAGWEFSSLGTPAQIMDKFSAFSHSEFDHVISEQIFADRIAQGQDLLGRDITMTPVEIDDTWPEAIKDDREYWSKYEWKLDL